MLASFRSALSSRIPPSLSLAWFSSTPSSPNMSNVKELVETTIAQNPIVIFSKSYCPASKRAKALFAGKFPGVEATILELDEREDGSDIQKYLKNITKQGTVPNIFVKQQHIGGADDTTVAYKSGKLAGLLKAVKSPNL